MSPCWRGSHPAIFAPLVVGLLLVVTAHAQPPRIAGDNLLANPGFENGLSQWSICNGQAAPSTARFHEGGASVELSKSTGIGEAAVCQTVPVTPLASYSASGWFYLDATGVRDGKMVIAWPGVTGAEVVALASCSTPGVWCANSVSVQAPANASSALIKVRVYVGNVNAVAYVDDASFTETAPPPTATATSSPTDAATTTDTPSPTIAPPTETPTATSTGTASPTLPASTPTATSTSAASPTRPASTSTPTSTRTRTPSHASTVAPPTHTMTRAPVQTPTRTASSTATTMPAPPARILINEVEYHPHRTDLEAYYEWLELHNASGITATLSGWTISDNVSSDKIPDLVLGPGQFVVVAARRAGFLENYPGYSAALVELGQAIGNGLANTGDRLILRDRSGQIVDALSYGADVTVFSPAVPTVTSKGSSLERRPAGQDTDSAGDFQTHDQPSPGRAWHEADPTATATVTAPPAPPTASSTPTATNSATATPPETATPSPTQTATDTATPSQTATAADTATPSPTATAAETITATPTGTATLSPMETPPATPEPTATPTVTALAIAPPSATSSASPSPTATATTAPPPTATTTATVTATHSPTSTARTYTLFLPILVREPPPTPTHSATPNARLVTINEFLPKPDAIDWNGDGEIDSGDEWVELYNAAPLPMDVSGWALDDEADAGSPLYFLPAGTVIPPHGFLLLFGAQTGINLANTKDVVRLLYRNGALLEEYRYWATWADRSFSKTTDGGHEWTYWYPPSPGRPNLP